MNEQDRRRWQEVFDKMLESWEESITSAIVYDKEERCFYVSSNPTTYAEIMESAENDAFEEYDDLPDWDTKDEKLNTLFHEYLGKIRLICERWERHIMRAAENFDLHHQHDSEEQTAVEMYKEYFDHFWGRSGRS